ncbi:MAG: hypothetical protein PHV30_10405 [Candidatus Margulisbacteria bacterium]|nr:hypothetical protein [Candidatus Margulisiibacteriota bacterium]
MIKIELWGISIRILLLLLILSLSYGIIDPIYTGAVDLRYLYSKNTYKSTGTFTLNDMQLNVKFPLNKNYEIYYETHLTTQNMELFNQLYLDLDGNGWPVNTKIGRFLVAFGNEKINQIDKEFISNSLLRDTIWGNNVYLIPREETGIDVYYHSRPFSADFYLVNGKGSNLELNNDKEGKSFGTDLRFLLRDFLDMGLSLYFSDMSDTTFYGSNNQYILLGNDYAFSFWDIDLSFAFLAASGKLNGVSQEMNGVMGQAFYKLNPRLSFGGNVSLLTRSGALDMRGLAGINYLLYPDIYLRSELLLDRINSVTDYQIQIQLLVRL